MNFRLIPAFLIFLGSYFPLALILALQDIKQEYWQLGVCYEWRHCVLPSMNNPFFSIAGIMVTFFCLLLTAYTLQKLRYKYPIIVKEAKPIPSELISYSFPYIVLFMGVDYGSAGKVAGLAAFLIWLFLITHRAGQIIMNPILLILGWNLYEVKAEINGHDRIIKLLTKTNPVPGKYLCQEIQGNYICDGDREQ